MVVVDELGIRPASKGFPLLLGVFLAHVHVLWYGLSMQWDCMGSCMHVGSVGESRGGPSSSIDCQVPAQ